VRKDNEQLYFVDINHGLECRFARAVWRDRHASGATRLGTRRSSDTLWRTGRGCGLSQGAIILNTFDMSALVFIIWHNSYITGPSLKLKRIAYGPGIELKKRNIFYIYKFLTLCRFDDEYRTFFPDLYTHN